MKYENYEKMIINRLRSCQGLNVLSCEIDSSALNRKQSSNPNVYVLYQGSVYDNPDELAVIAQAETMTFEIIIFAQKQRGEKGIYAAFESITKRLLGYREKGMRTPILFQKFGYVSETNAIYQYALQCSFTGYIVECRDEDTEVPLINNINIIAQS